jgi:hypothetical protein
MTFDIYFRCIQHVWGEHMGTFPINDLTVIKAILEALRNGEGMDITLIRSKHG